MSVKINLLKNAGANLWSKISVVLFRLLQVPLLIATLGVEDFGRWLVLTSFPSWLLLANLGFGSVASNDMSMSVASGDTKRAGTIFSTTVALVSTIGIFGTLIITVVAPFIPVEQLLQAPAERHTELSLAVIWLSVCVFISFYEEVFAARFRAARKAHKAVLLSSLLPWLDLIAIFIALQLSKRFDHIALALLIATTIHILLVKWFSWKTAPQISFKTTDIKISQFRFLFRKGLAFLAFPLGNALLFQGHLFIVQAVMGPAAVALFGTARTLIRTVNHGMDLVNQAIWPEFSHLFGAGNITKAAKLHRTGVAVSIVLAISGVIVLTLFGKDLYSLWVGKSINLPFHLLLIFLLPIPFHSFWFTSSVVHVACNQHEGLAVRYLFAALLSAVACLLLSKYQGIEGAAVSTLLADILLIPYVLKRSLSFTQDSFRNFFSSMPAEIIAIPLMLKERFSGLSTVKK